MSARDVIAETIKRTKPREEHYYSEYGPVTSTDYNPVAAAVEEALTAAGYRILAPGELDGPTIEACAVVAENRDPHWPDDGDHIATCIRNLGASNA